ncbi:hypothetical protein LIER_34536 [Lithospermum erythrorhizon]|uniref:Cystatin domain-containing protein n=1 Tax=Lithospermum erythrorhizon TaxID=34254 RepID=A0AAV3RZY3_LITER
MESISSSTYFKITLALLLGVLLVVDVTSDEFTFSTKGFVPRNVDDPEIVRLAQFALDEHNKAALPLSGVTFWKYFKVSTAMSKDSSPTHKKVVVRIFAEDGPIADICEALVDVNRNIPKLLKFKEPVQEEE